MKILEKNKHKIVVLAIIAIGILVRVIQFGMIPGGFNQDEAFAGYEAYSLLHYGIDSAGYTNPCYFVSWGSGMNVLESYLAIPFVKLFGLSVVTIRLPQMILGCISLLVFYLLLKEIFSKRVATIGLFILAISPWHIMLSRWGLESNLAPSFLLFGFYFFVKGIKNNTYWIVAAVMYGLALYGYAITWLVVPLTLAACCGYLLVKRQKVSFAYSGISVAVLFVLALPLLLFVLVNQGMIPEIRTSFLSIPKMLQMRESELSLRNLIDPYCYEKFFSIVISQDDGMLWNSTKDFGLFYKVSIPFIIIGVVKLISTVREAFRKKEFSYEAIVLLGMMCSVCTCLLIEKLNVNKANSLHMYTLIMITLGIEEVFTWCKENIVAQRAILAMFGVSFISFCNFYFGSYNDQITKDFKGGVEEVVKFVKESNFEQVCVDSSITYPQIMFFDQTNTPTYRDTVVYGNYPSAFLEVKSFDKYTFGIDYSNLEEHKTYVIPQEKKQELKEAGFKVKNYINYAVAYK